MESGHTLILFILVLAAAKVGGELAECFRQPAVLGELLVGVILGMTPLREALGDSAIAFVASIGIILLLFETGLGSETSEFVKVGRSAFMVAVVGVVLPLAIGYAIVLAARGDHKEALFLGAALTATSVGITARVLADLGKSRTKEARIILGAAVIDDILGLLILAIVLQMVTTGGVQAPALLKSVFLALLFLVGAVWLGRRYACKLTAFAQRLKTRGVLVSIAFLFCLSLALAARKLGLAEIVGAFAAGLVLAETEDRVRIEDRIKPIADIFVPVFFLMVGMQVDVREMNPFEPAQRANALLGLVLLVVAIGAKMASGLAARGKGVNRLAVGVGMVPRGEVGLIFATLGLQMGVVTAGLYAQLVMVVFVTTLITPLWLKRIYARRPVPETPAPAEEQVEV